MMIAAGRAGAQRARAEEQVRQQQAQAGAGVRLDHEQDRLAVSAASATPSGPSTPWLMALLRNSTLAGSTRTEASGSRLWSTSQSTPLPAQLVSDSTTGPMPQHAEQRHAAADDAGGEVVDQHLEAGLDPVLEELVEQLEQVRGERADDHRAEEHRHVGADDDAHGGDGADHGAALAVDQPAAGVADQDRQQHGDHRVDQLGEVSLGSQPVGMNRAVIRPQAMNAPMLGMTMPAR